MFLTTGDLKERFKANLARSRQICVATAWATEGPALDLLSEAALRGIRVKAIVGTFDNATHPDALERLREIGKLRLVTDALEMFHPKVYIFRCGAQSCAWIGSANFTRSGFARNEEVVFETTRIDDALAWFKGRWKKCGVLEPSAIDDYRKRRRKQGVSRELVRLVGRADAGATRRLALLQGADGWKAYIAALKECDESWQDEVLGWSVLGAEDSYVATIEKACTVARKESWIGLPPSDISMLLGLDDSDGNWGLLGSMAGAGTARTVFMNSQESANKRILRRLRGAVDRVIQADDATVAAAAVSVLKELRPLTGFGPGVVTRLLALARPERLVSVNGGSCNGLSKLFSPSKSTIGEPEKYGRLLEELYRLPWYGGVPSPSRLSRRERQLWNMRAALIDSFVYEPTK